MSKLSRYNLLISYIQREYRCPHVLASLEASKENEVLIQRGIEGLTFVSEDLMCENNIGVQSRNTRITKLLRYINTIDFSHVVNSLKDIYDLLINHISQKEMLSNYADFKGRITQQYQDIDIGILVSPIKESLLKVITSQTLLSGGCYLNASTRDMGRCAQYLLFLSKTNFEGVGLEESALTDYLLFEQETAEFQVESVERYIPAIQRILTSWLKNWRYDGSLSRHGSGSVADARHAKFDKYVKLGSDLRVKYLLNHFPDMETTAFPRDGVQLNNRTSKLCFVPKNVKKLRSISMEPATLQYLQQGCMLSLYQYFRTDKNLRHILKLEDQNQNKCLAYDGSITDIYATIDLSHASDSVNWSLVKRCFSRLPHLLRWLVCTRSTHTELPTGVVIELKKFAPMGSALCFPIESLIFAAIAKLSILLSQEAGLDRDNEQGTRSRHKFFSVYGDDIIVPTYAGKTCLTLLKLFGFSPNNEKSYLTGPFKESCGGNYFCGYDITPIKFTPKFRPGYPGSISPEAYSALCSYANLAYSKGLTMFRLYCIKTLLDNGIKPLFCDRLDQSPAIFSPNPTNFHLLKIYRKRYQKYEYLYTGVKAVESSHRKDDDDESLLLFDWFITNRNRRVTLSNGIDADFAHSTISTDAYQPYNRSTLYEHTFMFNVCRRDA